MFRYAHNFENWGISLGYLLSLKTLQELIYCKLPENNHEKQTHQMDDVTRQWMERTKTQEKLVTNVARGKGAKSILGRIPSANNTK